MDKGLKPPVSEDTPPPPSPPLAQGGKPYFSARLRRAIIYFDTFFPFLERHFLTKIVSRDSRIYFQKSQTRYKNSPGAPCPIFQYNIFVKLLMNRSGIQRAVNDSGASRIIQERDSRIVKAPGTSRKNWIGTAPAGIFWYRMP